MKRADRAALFTGSFAKLRFALKVIGAEEGSAQRARSHFLKISDPLGDQIISNVGPQTDLRREPEFDSQSGDEPQLHFTLRNRTTRQGVALLRLQKIEAQSELREELDVRG